MDLVLNRAAWTRVRLADLADAIRRVDRLAGGSRLVDRFLKADQYSGVILELDLAATALRSSLLVELEPATQTGRFCDFSVALPGVPGATTVFVEVQAIQDLGANAKRAMEVTDRLAPRALWMTLNHELLGEIYRIPTDGELEHLIPASEAFWTTCEGSNRPEHLQLEDVMDVWAIPFGHHAKADLIAAGVPEHFASPVPDDPLRRMVRAIRSKIGQLPRLAPGLIVVRPPRLLALNRQSLPQIMSAVQAAISASPQVSAVALIEWTNQGIATPSHARVSIDGAIVVAHPDRHIFVRELIVIRNPARAYEAGDRVIDRFI